MRAPRRKAIWIGTEPYPALGLPVRCAPFLFCALSEQLIGPAVFYQVLYHLEIDFENNLAYRRPDGVLVVPIGTLGT